MAYISGETLTITTDASGNATAFTSGLYTGFLHAINYVKDGSTPYSNGVVITVTGESSGMTLWAETLGTNNSAIRYPRAATHTTAGAASLYAAAGTAVNDKIPLLAERIKIVLASGGNTLKGAFTFYIG